MSFTQKDYRVELVSWLVDCLHSDDSDVVFFGSNFYLRSDHMAEASSFSGTQYFSLGAFIPRNFKPVVCHLVVTKWIQRKSNNKATRSYMVIVCCVLLTALEAISMTWSMDAWAAVEGS